MTSPDRPRTPAEFVDPVDGVRWVLAPAYAAGYGGLAERQRYDVGFALLAYRPDGRRIPKRDIRIAYPDAERFAEATAHAAGRARITDHNWRTNVREEEEARDALAERDRRRAERRAEETADAQP